MSEILDGCGRFDDVYRKAYWAKTSLDCTTDVFDEETAISDCISYFKERRKNTTVGDIAYAEVVRKNPLGETEYTKDCHRRIKITFSLKSLHMCQYVCIYSV